jgi:hypothetical protein
VKNVRYVDVLPEIVDAINRSYHRVIKCRPVDVTRENENEIWERRYGKYMDSDNMKFKFDVGDKVRISKYKHIFEKGYLPNFTKEIFVIVSRFQKKPPVYKVKDLDDETIEGMFYEQQLVKVVPKDDVYEIDKILKTRKRDGRKEYLVKWEGYSDEYNQWISASDLVTT